MTSFKKDLDGVFESLRKLEDQTQEEVYENFRKVAGKSSLSERYGLTQLGHGNFVGQYDKETNKEQLKRLVRTGQREAGSLQNLNVYEDMLEIHNRTDSLSHFLNSVENYIEKGSEHITRSGGELYNWANADSLEFEESEYLEEIIEDLTEDVMRETGFIK